MCPDLFLFAIFFLCLVWRFCVHIDTHTYKQRTSVVNAVWWMDEES